MRVQSGWPKLDSESGWKVPSVGLSTLEADLALNFDALVRTWFVPRLIQRRCHAYRTRSIAARALAGVAAAAPLVHGVASSSSSEGTLPLSMDSS